MALLASCFCCSLSVCCGVLGLYLLVAYIIAVTIELWWIAEAQDVLPVPAYLLTVGYLLLFIFSGALLYGLHTKKSTFLLVWMFLMGILLGPEAGMVLYMSIHHWRINTLNGLIEITFWACRLLVNATALLCVQSLYSTWRDDKSMMLRLQALKMSPVPGQARDRLGSIKIPPRHEYLNHGYQQDDPKQNVIPNYQPQTILDNFFVAPLDSPCEFNASSFNTNVIDARVLKQQEMEKELSKQRTQSLLDIPEEEYNNAEDLKNMNNKSISLNYINKLGKPEDITQSLDRKMLKTKNLKIMKKLSPFLGRKTTDEINVYQIHPPKVIKSSGDDEVDSGVEMRRPTNLDRQLNQVYSSRGMYSYDENIGKLIYYPPEFFNHGEMRQLRRSTESSRSSMDDSEEIRSRIGDVAL